MPSRNSTTHTILPRRNESSKKIRESTSHSSENVAIAPAAPTDDPSARPRTARPARPQPTFRLASVEVMNAADQRQLERLLDALVEQRVVRALQGRES